MFDIDHYLIEIIIYFYFYFILLYLPTNHFSNINEIVKNKSNQLKMCSKTLNISD